MSKSVKKAKSSIESPDPVPFEKGIERLQAILEQMETEDLPLEKLLAQYAEGTRMVGDCQKKLTDAELKIQQLEKKPSGEFELKGVTIGDSNE